MNLTSQAPLWPVRMLLLVGTSLLAGGAPRLMAADWQSLVQNSPFGQATTTAAGAPGEIEFRAVVEEDGSFLVNLYNPATKTSQWIKVNGSEAGIDVKSYDPSSDRLQITQGGRALTLDLKQAKTTLVANVAPPPVPADNDKGVGTPSKEELAARRAAIRELIRARMAGGGRGPQTMTPEAQAMIEEFRRRRAGAVKVVPPPKEEP